MFRRLACALAAAFFLAPVAASALDLDAMTEAERSAFRAEVRAYLLENPEVLMEAIGVLEQRQTQAAAQNDVMLVRQYADALFNDGYSYVGGNPDGDITLVEFMDYRCSYCRKAAPEVAELLETDGNIRWVVKEFPILGDESVAASRFAISVLRNGGEEAYGIAHKRLMSHRGNYDERTLRRMAEDLGLDADVILAGMDDREVTRIIGMNRDLAQRLDITGTPSFVLETQFIRGFLPLAGMREQVRQVRAAQN